MDELIGGWINRHKPDKLHVFGLLLVLQQKMTGIQFLLLSVLLLLLWYQAVHLMINFKENCLL